MVLNTLTVGAAVTPTVIETYISHYLNRKPRAQKPTAHISYDEGLHLIRQFLHYVSYHTVEEVQAFTSQWVPSPRWVRKEDIEIPQTELSKAADAIIAQLGHKGIDKIGGKTWWQWRKDDRPLGAEWIEMRSDYNRRQKSGDPCKRVMLYVHGGAYFFGSVDEHRYQMQRHARKLNARVFAPRYRLAPQYPFPCGLHDCLAAYLHLLTLQDPTTIVLAGDSAGGAMVVSMLVILRDQGLPLPAGAVLISPWVDLTHSFPSVAAGSDLDYIPEHGFLQRPSAAWPPPNADDMRDIALHAIEEVATAQLPRKSTQQERDQLAHDATRGFSVEKDPKDINPKTNKNNPTTTNKDKKTPGNTVPGKDHDLSIMIDGNMVEIKDQIQMYTTNQLISHPLVSPVLQPSLGGLPPLMILTGGGEMLRDEQIYLAHKAANPSKYLPGEVLLNDYPDAREIAEKYEPTDVQLQVWDDLCHVAPTLSFTRPAKFMYRSVAQFGAWALARAQKTEIEILDDDDVSIISSGSDTDVDDQGTRKPKQKGQAMENGVLKGGVSSTEEVGKAGDPLPPFQDHMIRQRVDRHGIIFPLDPPSSLPALQMKADEIGSIKPVPVRKWMAAKSEWDSRFAKEKRRVQKVRIKEMVQGYRSFGNDEVPPPSALAGRIGASMPKDRSHKRSWGLSLWSLWGSSHDEKTLQREEHADKLPESTSATQAGDKNSHAQDSLRPGIKQSKSQSSNPRSRSRHRAVSDLGQAGGAQGNDSSTAKSEEEPHSSSGAAPASAPAAAAAKQSSPTHLSPDFVPLSSKMAATPVASSLSSSSSPLQKDSPQLILPGTNITLDSAEAKRPKADGIAFPFKLGSSRGRMEDEDAGTAARNASTVTLMSERILTPKGEKVEGAAEKMLGAGADGSASSMTGKVEAEEN